MILLVTFLGWCVKTRPEIKGCKRDQPNDRGSKGHGLNHLVGGGFKHLFMFTPGEMIQFDDHIFQIG